MCYDVLNVIGVTMDYKTATNFLNEMSQDFVRSRKLKGITQSDMSRRLKVSQSTYCRWERTNFKSTKLEDFLKCVKYLETIL